MKTASPWSDCRSTLNDAYTLDRTVPDEWYARRRDLHLITRNTHTRQWSIPLSGFEPTIPASERLQTHTLDSAATGTGKQAYYILDVTVL